MAAPIVTVKCTHCKVHFKAKSTKTRQCSAECYFLANVRLEGDCYIWSKTGRRFFGYGIAHYDNKELAAHRFSYTTFCGDIPDGHVVCHKCDNTSCVRPSHLFVGTQTDNMRDMIAKGRSRIGRSNNYSAKLTMDQALAIRSDTRRVVDIAASYNISASTVYNIKSGLKWKNA